MDNCSGQNKNRMVIRLAPLIVELGLYKKVNFAFLVARHTKNSCDHLFNILKLKYRKSDIFSIEMLVKTVNQCHLVDAVRAKEDDFKDYDKFLNLIYKGIESGTVNRAHIFQCDSQNPMILWIGDTTQMGAHESIQNLAKNSDQRQEILKNFPGNIATINPPGLPDVKKVEMYSKYRSFLPNEFQDVLCPFPGQDVIDRINKTRNEKRTEKKKPAQQKAASTKRKDPPSHQDTVEKSFRTQQEPPVAIRPPQLARFIHIRSCQLPYYHHNEHIWLHFVVRCNHFVHNRSCQLPYGHRNKHKWLHFFVQCIHIHIHSTITLLFLCTFIIRFIMRTLQCNKFGHRSATAANTLLLQTTQ